MISLLLNMMEKLFQASVYMTTCYSRHRFLGKFSFLGFHGTGLARMDKMHLIMGSILCPVPDLQWMSNMLVPFIGGVTGVRQN